MPEPRTNTKIWLGNIGSDSNNVCVCYTDLFKWAAALRRKALAVGTFTTAWGSLFQIPTTLRAKENLDTSKRKDGTRSLY